MKNQNELKKFMQPLGGMQALRFMMEAVGVKLNPQAVHSFNRQAIPAKYTPAILLIKNKFSVDLTPFVRDSERVQPELSDAMKTIYPSLFEKLKGCGLGLVASEINQPRNKADLFPINPPKRFNHYSLKKLLTKKLSKNQREYFAMCFDAENEILNDEKLMAGESELLG